MPASLGRIWQASVKVRLSRAPHCNLHAAEVVADCEEITLLLDCFSVDVTTSNSVWD
jgi:hypothetical protein